MGLLFVSFLWIVSYRYQISCKVKLIRPRTSSLTAPVCNNVVNVRYIHSFFLWKNHFCKKKINRCHNMLEKTFILDTAQNDENNLFLGYCSSLQYRLQCWSCTTWFLNLFMYHHIASWPSRVAANQLSFCFRLVCVNGKKQMYTQY